MDKGGKEIGPLTAREVITLRYPTIMAYEFDEVVKAMKFTVTPEMSQGMLEEELDIVIVENGSMVKYAGIDFTNIAGIDLNILKAGQFMEGGKLEF